jgi:hypothetical protein
MVMEELHRIHKDVPFGYWVMWVQPAARALVRTWRAAFRPEPCHDHAVTLR